MKELVYAVEDEFSIRELYNCILESAGYDIICFEDGESLFTALESKKPDLILLDIMLEKKDGYEILSDLKSDKNYCLIPVIMVSAKGEEISKVKGLNLGADDFISKPFGVLELVARIKANLRKTVKQQKSSEYKDIKIDSDSHAIYIKQNQVQMTLKEYNLLKILVENAEKVVNREEILKTVWGYDYEGETRTLDMHIKELRKELLENNSKAEIITLRSVGYCLK